MTLFEILQGVLGWALVTTAARLCRVVQCGIRWDAAAATAAAAAISCAAHLPKGCAWAASIKGVGLRLQAVADGCLCTALRLVLLSHEATTSSLEALVGVAFAGASCAATRLVNLECRLYKPYETDPNKTS